jgi:Flp pilus assembly pilin Flp
MLTKLFSDRRGVSSMEYGILAVAVLAALVAGLALLTPQITALFGDVGAAITAAIAKVAT